MCAYLFVYKRIVFHLVIAPTSIRLRNTFGYRCREVFRVEDGSVCPFATFLWYFPHAALPRVVFSRYVHYVRLFRIGYVCDEATLSTNIPFKFS